MSTKVWTRNIPSSFIRMDDSITSADKFINVHDLNILAENHNILLARRVRRPIFSQMIVPEENVEASTTRIPDTDDRHGSLHEVGRLENREWFMEVPIYVSPLTYEVKVVVDAIYNALPGGATSTIYAALSSAEQQFVTTSDFSAEITATGAVSITLQVPGDIREKGGEAMFRLDVISRDDGTIQESPDAVIAIDPYGRWVDVDLGSPSGVLDSGSAALFLYATSVASSPIASIEGKTVKFYEDLGSTVRIWVEDPYWNGQVTTSMFANYHQLGDFIPYTISLYELEVTDFYLATEPPPV